MIKNFKKGELYLLVFNLLYVIGFAAYYISIKNFEFLWYVLVLVFFLVLIVSTLHKTKFDYIILWGLSIWGLLHMAGGGVPVGDSVLYGYELLPLLDNGGDFFILKFDQLVHVFGFGVATLVVYHMLKPYLKENTRWGVIYFILIVAGSGLGALNEIVEFAAFITLSETGVGGYANNALDLVFNTVGAILAVIFIHVRRLNE